MLARVPSVPTTSPICPGVNPRSIQNGLDMATSIASPTLNSRMKTTAARKFVFSKSLLMGSTYCSQNRKGLGRAGLFWRKAGKLTTAIARTPMMRAAAVNVRGQPRGSLAITRKPPEVISASL